MGNLKSLESQIYNCWWSYTEHGRTAHILKGRPLSLTPMYVQRDDYATELIRWLSIALRVLTLVEFGVRRQLAAEEATLDGLYAGNAKRETARPTAERLLEAFQE
jgi:transposase